MKKQHVCPWWLGYFLINPLRKYYHNPDNILRPYISPGMKIIDYGSAMGYFSIPMAKLTGNDGKVYCFDIQDKMLEKLVLRAKKYGQESIIQPCLITKNSDYNYLQQSIDFALLFAVAHEVPDQSQLFKFLAGLLKPGAQLFFTEPKGHVSVPNFSKSLEFAGEAGFAIRTPLKINHCYSVLLVKKEI
jgi:2-polyprenyl-3-methyl-5-hydroxy-6-metoxy-1,4-benzoquinol methylase